MHQSTASETGDVPTTLTAAARAINNNDAPQWENQSRRPSAVRPTPRRQSHRETRTAVESIKAHGAIVAAGNGCPSAPANRRQTRMAPTIPKTAASATAE